LPTEFAAILPGDTVVDLGSGAGNDCFVARAETGDTGRVIGVDFTPDMIERARQNAAKLGYTNVEFVAGDIENIPLPDNTADVVVSNCVFNLVPDKPRAFAVESPLPEEVTRSEIFHLQNDYVFASASYREVLGDRWTVFGGIGYSYNCDTLSQRFNLRNTPWSLAFHALGFLLSTGSELHLHPYTSVPDQTAWAGYALAQLGSQCLLPGAFLRHPDNNSLHPLSPYNLINLAAQEYYQ